MNAGAVFGHRLGALFAVAMLRRFDIASWIDAPSTISIDRVSFETNHPTDDLLVSSGDVQLFVQAKRSLSLSALDESEFRGVVRQFVCQWLSLRAQRVLLLLALGPRASQRVSQELRKILAGLRSGDHGDDPLTVSELETLNTFRATAEAIYREASGNEMSFADFKQFVDCVRISSFDVEGGGADERTAIVLCAIPGLSIGPELLWAEIMRISASSASARQSLGRDALNALVTKWIELEPTRRSDAFFDVLIARDIPCGREVIAIRHDKSHKESVAVIEFPRFNPDGTRRARFEAEGCTLRGGVSGPLVARAGTLDGLAELLKERLSNTDHVTVLESPNPRREELEDEPQARAHRAELNRALRRDRLLQCVECGQAVAESTVPVVEVDQIDVPFAFGVIHPACARPCHRRSGVIQVPFFARHSRLRGFDLERWARALHRGQAVFQINPVSRRATLAWSPPNMMSRSLPSCVRLEFEGGLVQYLTQRMRVQRFSETEAETAARSIQALVGGPDPACISEDTRTFASVSALSRARPTEKPLLLVNAAAARVTVPILDSYGSCENFYAPLMVVLVGKEQALFTLGGMVVFMTDPLEFDRYHANWLRAGIVLEEYRIEILATDDEFDNVVASVFGAGMTAIVDPLLASDGRLVGGAPIVPLPR